MMDKKLLSALSECGKEPSDFEVKVSVTEVGDSPDTWCVEYFDHQRRRCTATFAGPVASRRAVEYAIAIGTGDFPVTAFPG
jgi:hypothetical protein